MKSNIPMWNLNNRRVLLRIDANVPMEHGVILNDQRLLASLPTINMLLDKGAHIVLLTHVGRPQKRDPELSTKNLLPWFLHAKYDISFASSIDEAKQQLDLGHKLVLFENLRFFPEEKAQSIPFAAQLASLGTYYVNDAFGSLHRTDTSIVLLPEQFDAQHRTIGLLVEHELNMLDNITKYIKKPFLLIVGGGKAHDKIPLIAKLLPKLSALFVGPGICFTFLKTIGQSVGKSFVDNSLINLTKDIIAHAAQLQIPIYYPTDYIVAQNGYDGPLDIIHSSEIPIHDVGVSIGPKTAQEWSQHIIHGKTIFINGLMGSMERPDTLSYVYDLFQATVVSGATSIIAGGDSVAAAYHFKLAQDISYISTGGGATLQYISGEPLPGLMVLKNGAKT